MDPWRQGARVVEVRKHDHIIIVVVGSCQAGRPPPGANGETNYTAHTVTVREDLEPAQAVRTLVHERAHIALRHGDELRTTGCRGRIEVEATAYVVCTEMGMEASTYSLPDVAGWANGDTDLVTATAERVISAAREITDALNTDDTRTPVSSRNGR